MTQEEKAKAYDEALKKAKDFYKGYKQRDNQLYADDLESIFPELKESEDEKIKNSLKKCLESLRDDAKWSNFYGSSFESIFAWIEKQGEQKENATRYKIAKYLKDLILDQSQRGFPMLDYEGRIEEEVDFIINIAKNELKKEKQGEQETFCDKCIKEHPSNSCQDITELGKCAVENEQKLDENVIEKEDMTEYNKGFECGKQRVLKYPEDFDLCKSHAWSEEDEKMLLRLIAHFDWHGNTRFTKEDCQEATNWLKSIRPQNSWIIIDKEVYVKEPVLAQKKDKSDQFQGYVLCCDHTLMPNVYERYMILSNIVSQNTWKPNEEQKSVDKVYTFRAIPRLLDMIQPTDKAKSYCQKLIASLEQEGYSTDAKIVRGCLKRMNGEKVAMATMDEQKPDEWSEEDKKMLGKVLECIRFAESYYLLEGEPNGVSVRMWLLEHINPQHRQEWGEEDEVKLNRIVACLENLNVPDNDIDVEWLKSLKFQNPARSK